jgi:glutamate synthase (NADPH/NADH) small chain
LLPHQIKQESIGIIGAGPAGLSAAEQLRKQGYEIEVYDRYDRAGGLLIYGIPSFKLEKEIVQRRTKYLEDSGIKFNFNIEIGKDLMFEDIKSKHDSVLIATGVYKAKTLNTEKDFPNVIPALDFLIASNKKGLGDQVPLFDNGKLNAEGKDVVVVGGGDTAMDCVRTSIRQQAKSVKCLYRRDKENMPGSAREVLNAEEEGVEFLWKSAPKDFIGHEIVSEVLCSSMQLSDPDGSGRQIPEVIEGADYKIKADMVITALGFDPEDIPKMFGVEELNVTKWGTLKTEFKSMMTDIEGVFAAGDIVRGASLVVWGIRDGRDVAESIHSFIQEKNERVKKVS